jgi:hypothetical protein
MLTKHTFCFGNISHYTPLLSRSSSHDCRLLVYFPRLSSSRLLPTTVVFTFTSHDCRLLIDFPRLSSSRLLPTTVVFSSSSYDCRLASETSAAISHCCLVFFIRLSSCVGNISRNKPLLSRLLPTTVVFSSSSRLTVVLSSTSHNCRLETFSLASYLCLARCRP